MSKVDEYRQRLEAHERKDAEAARSMDLKELVQRSRELKSVWIEGLGELKYGALTFADLVELSKLQSNEERTVAIVHAMLKKAYPDLSIEDVRNLPFEASVKILTALGKEIGFLRAI